MKDNQNQGKDHEFRWILDNIKTWDHRQLLADLTILSKDLAEYLAPRALTGPGADVFWQSYLEVLNHDRWFWEMFEEEEFLYKPLLDRFPDLPEYAAAAAMDPTPAFLNIDYLKTPELVQTWTFVKGWEFLKKYIQTLSVNVAAMKAAYEQATDLSFEEKVLQIFDKLRQERYPEPFWIPLLMFASYLFAWSCFEPLPPSSNQVL